MERNVFVFNASRTAGGKGCTKQGVCGKQADTANHMDMLTGALIGLARAAEGKTPGTEAKEIVMEGLFATITNVNFDTARIEEYAGRARRQKELLGGAEDYPTEALFHSDPDITSLRSTLILGLRGMAAYAWHAYTLGKEDPEVTAWFFKGLRAVGAEHSVGEWLDLLMEFGQANLKCMARAG